MTKRKHKRIKADKKQALKANTRKTTKKLPQTRLSTKKALLLLSIGLTIGYYLIFQFSARLDSSCFIGGDTWEYQSMGVNLAKGHGINKFGAFEPFEVYKFTFGDENNVASFKERQSDNFRRTPGYPFFLGMVYKIFGVSVSAAKQVQLFLIAIIAGFIPLLGRVLHSRYGYITGLVAGPFIMLSSFRMSELIMTEALTAFALFAMMWAIAYYFKKQGVSSSIIMGAVIGVALLIKGALIFIPMILVLLMILEAIQSKSIKPTKAMVGMILGIALFVLPWSWYATDKRGEFTLLSTQGTELLLDSNNELTKDGSWHPSYRKDKNNPEKYYHNQPQRINKSSLQKVISFYSEYPQSILPTFSNKLNLGLNPFPYLWIIFITMILAILKRYIPEKTVKSNILIPLILLLAFGSAGVLVFLSDHQYIPNGNIFGSPLLPKSLAVIMALWFIISSFIAAIRKEKSFLGIPLIFFIIVSNFILLTLVFYGSVRFIKVADFAFVFFAFFLPVKWMIDLKPNWFKRFQF
ncbi:MAG: hypothetical protein HKN68_22765 [Saprospiraceae bacterium]|nr:hypothetical protein [Saprospiraceae bacterium]